MLFEIIETRKTHKKTSYFLSVFVEKHKKLCAFRCFFVMPWALRPPRPVLDPKHVVLLETSLHFGKNLKRNPRFWPRSWKNTLVLNGGFSKLGKTQLILNSAPGSLPMADAWGQLAERGVAFRKPLIISVLVRGFLELNRPKTQENTAVFAFLLFPCPSFPLPPPPSTCFGCKNRRFA